MSTSLVLVLLLSIVLPLSGGNLITRASLPQPAVVLKHAPVSSSLPSLLIPDIRGLQAGRRHQLRIRVTPAAPAPECTLLCQIRYQDQDGKQIGVSDRKLAVREYAPQSFIATTTPPPRAVSASLAIHLYGLVQENSFTLDQFSLTADPLPDATGNLMINGSFEEPSLMEYWIVSRHGKRSAAAKSTGGGMTIGRSALKARTGRHSLLCVSPFEDATNTINLNMLPFRPGTKYRIQADYFIASAAGKPRMAGRLIFFDKANKPLDYRFPEGDVTPGKWHRMQVDFHPPAGTARVTATLWLIGKLRVYVDDIFYGELKNQKVGNRSAAALLLHETPDFCLWKEAPYLKVQPQGTPASMKTGKGVAIELAANETEPFQLVVTARKKLDRLSLAFSSVVDSQTRHSIPAKNLSYRIVEYIDLKNPDNTSLKGLNADPLVPAEPAVAEPSRNLPFYIQVKADPRQPAGTYNGAITLLADGQRLAEVPLTVRVRRFSLPDTANLRTYMYTRPLKPFMKLDKRPFQVISDDFMRVLHEHRMNGNQGIGAPAPKWKLEGDKVVVTDWTAFDQTVDKWHLQYGMVNIPMPLLGMLGDNSGWWGGDRSKTGRIPFSRDNWLSPKGLAYMGQYARQLTAHVRQRHPGVNFYAYIYDEPPAKVQKDLTTIANALHQAAPELKIFIPKQVTDKIGYVHTFCVPLSPGHFNAQKQEQAVKDGKDIWFYNWTVHLDDFDYIRNRIYPWQIYMGDGIGGLLWNTVVMSDGVNPWTDLDKTYACGGATLFYPPRRPGETVVPSLRAAQLRESIDDFDYMHILQTEIDRRYPGTGRRRVKEILGELFTAPPSPFDFIHSPHLLYAIRSRLADEIESLDRAPAAVVVSTPPEHTVTDVTHVVFHVYAPCGSAVEINGRPRGTVDQSPLDLTHILDRLGRQEVRIKVTADGQSVRLARFYTLRQDRNLQELAKTLAKADAIRLAGTEDARQFLRQHAGSGAYTEAHRTKTRQLLDQLKEAIMTHAMKNSDGFGSALSQAMFKRAQATFARRQFSRAEYYLNLAKESAAYQPPAAGDVRLTAVDFKGHSAFRLDNGLVSAVVLETGGRLISFQVKGVETLTPGGMQRILPPERRSAQHITPDLTHNVSGYGGYEDAGGGDLWPVSFVDWDMDFLELSPTQVTLAFSTDVFQKPFRFRRTMSLAKGSRDLVMNIEITSAMPASQASDDPEHQQLSWRGRFVPAIGNDTDNPVLNDHLMLKPIRPELKLAANVIDPQHPLMYERRSIRLGEPCMGAYDPSCKTGVAFIGDQHITHAYVWFDSKGAKNIYTLEYPRSFYGKRFNDPEANRPFTIPPEQSINFKIIVRGMENVTTDQDFWQQAQL